jgi:hypothetical protein
LAGEQLLTWSETSIAGLSRSGLGVSKIDWTTTFVFVYNINCRVGRSRRGRLKSRFTGASKLDYRVGGSRRGTIRSTLTRMWMATQMWWATQKLMYGLADQEGRLFVPLALLGRHLRRSATRPTPVERTESCTVRFSSRCEALPRRVTSRVLLL